MFKGHLSVKALKGQPLWAFQLSDPDTDTVAGLAEPAMLISLGMHAREWAPVEVVTGIVEHLAENSADGGIHQYLLENTNIVVVPVNPDGFRQTQRFPDQSIIGTDPDFPDFFLRDGRLRRKSMNGVDQNLFTFNDHLLGVDLNRQWPPFFRYGGSGNPDSQLYRGPDPLSEPETQALVAGANLGPSNRLRLYTDFHSFTKIFIQPNTLNTRRNRLTTDLANKLLDTLSALGAEYQLLIFARNEGIGAADEYHAEVFQIPSWTLEVEPTEMGGIDYGGFGLPGGDDGFIMPDSEIARVRSQLRQAYIRALYHQAGPASVAAVQIRDKATGEAVYDAVWQTQSAYYRALQVGADQALQRSRDYTLWIAFDKPMRWRQDGQIVSYPGQQSPLTPQISLIGTGINIPIDGTSATWLAQPGNTGQGALRYRDDAFTVDFSVPADLNVSEEVPITLALNVSDLADLQLDADPATPVDWIAGGWSSYEDSNGLLSDTGGTDTTIVLKLR